MALLTRNEATRDAQIARKGTFCASSRARQERVSRHQEGPRARKNVTHIVTILCVQGAPRATQLLPRHARFSLLSRPYVPIL